jgi:hypothetical protein
LLRNRQKTQQNKTEQAHRGRGLGGGAKEKKATLFYDGPRWNKNLKKKIVFLNSACYETPKNAIKKIKGKCK